MKLIKKLACNSNKKSWKRTQHSGTKERKEPTEVYMTDSREYSTKLLSLSGKEEEWRIWQVE